MLLWPDAENWPIGGEVDFMEIGDEARQEVDFFLHYGEDNSQLHDQVTIDATQWHNWAVEWSPDEDHRLRRRRTVVLHDAGDALPPGSMHLTLQLDWFPKGGCVPAVEMASTGCATTRSTARDLGRRSRTAWTSPRAPASRSTRSPGRARARRSPATPCGPARPTRPPGTTAVTRPPPRWRTHGRP